MARVWIFQQPREKKALGDKAPWYVGWYQGRSRRSKKIGTKTAARAYQSRLEAAANADEFTGTVKTSWAQARAEYDSDVMATRRSATQVQSRIALDHVERILRPTTVADISRAELTRFAAERVAEGVSKHTVNKDLRMLRAFLREAARRKYIFRAPEIPFLKAPGKVPTYVSPEAFSQLYAACCVATEPAEQGFTAEQWWQAYLVFLYLTGWRAWEPLALTKGDIEWTKARVFLRAELNKGDRDEVVPLHPLVIEHLEQIKSFGPHLLPWPLPRRKLWDIFHRIQDAAGVKRRDGKHYGFHDLRRGFATMNADRMSSDALQVIMRHRDYSTTKRYINMARQMNPATQAIFVPKLPGKAGGA
ncbi:MAG: tyrosine-type recombinase/integrase [Planctomycetaceae bacterium]|nr:tyrosine-type recombinase/integrase [Planctomycetaceae bacterium]